MACAPSWPCGGNYFRLHKHVELTADGCRTVSRQPIEIVHHVHLIVISQSMGDVGPPRFGRCRLASERRLEPDNSGVQLGWDSDLVAKAPLELTGPQPRVVCKIGHSNASAAGEHSRCGGGQAPVGTQPRPLRAPSHVPDPGPLPPHKTTPPTPHQPPPPPP